MEMDYLIKLIETVSHSGLSKFAYEEDGVRIQMEKPETVRPQAMPITSETAVQTAEEKTGRAVTCPLVGIFYAAPEEGAKPFVKVGDTVKKGQTLAIVEAMKLMNEIESDFDGIVTEVLAENGQAVEFGQELFRIRQGE